MTPFQRNSSVPVTAFPYVEGHLTELLHGDRIPRRGIAAQDGIVYEDGLMIGSYQGLEVVVDATGCYERVHYLPVDRIINDKTKGGS